MATVIETNWLAFVLVLGIGLLVAWWLWGRSGDKRERHRGADALDQGAAPAKRNQALIDAPSAAAQVAAPLAASGPGIMAGIGEVVAMAAASEVTAAAASEVTAAAASEVTAAEAGKDGATPMPEPVAAKPVPVAGADDLIRLKGVGPKLSAKLAELGVSSFAEIAAWGEADIARVDAQLGTFAGRIVRDNWIEQAKLLAAGDKAGFEAKFGKL